MIDLVSYTNPGMNAIILVMVFAIFLGIGLLLVLTPVYAFHAPPPASLYYYFTNDPTLGYHDYDHDGKSCYALALSQGSFISSQILGQCEMLEIERYYNYYLGGGKGIDGFYNLPNIDIPPHYGYGNNYNDNGKSVFDFKNKLYDELTDESIGGYAGGMESDGEYHPWYGGTEDAFPSIGD